MRLSLRAIIEKDAFRPLPSGLSALCDAAIHQLGARDVVAVLVYGSCFRTGLIDDGLVDLYLLVDSYAMAHRSLVERLANRLVPPNVYYLEAESDGAVLRAKYAVVELRHLERLVSGSTRNPYFWARFAQPVGIARVAPESRDRLLHTLEAAVVTLYAHASALSPASSLEAWTGVLRETYRTELRVEKPARTLEIYRNDQERFDAIDRLLRDAPLPDISSAPWWLRRIEGKALSILRLVKAAFTFTGGASYLAWKIERHSGHVVALSNWQRRHPIIAALPILWRLWRARIVR